MFLSHYLLTNGYFFLAGLMLVPFKGLRALGMYSLHYRLVFEAMEFHFYVLDKV
jgi:hypothetical protein